MTFFNKKTEVMQIEMTPYGRYLYSIGKFKPHSYEFVDDDINYKVSGETQEAAHNRILNETPKLKVNRAFQEEAPQVESPSTIDSKRVMVKKNDMRQGNLYPLGKSSYSSENNPSFQATMLRGYITGSESTYEIPSVGGDLLIPQVDIDYIFVANSKNLLDNPMNFDSITSRVFDNGEYVEISYEEPIIHLKEFASFYEKENFDIEVFLVDDNDEQLLTPLKMSKVESAIVDGILKDGTPETPILDREGSPSVIPEDNPKFVEYYFSFEFDEDIDQEILCQAVSELEVNNQFLDEEVICPDKRTERFDIYSTRVGPDDLEDCD